MKLSKYITFLTIEGKHSIVFNALTQKFTIIRGTCLSSEHVLKDYLIKHPQVEKELISAGILIPDNTDEEALLISNLCKHRENNDVFIIHLNPTMDCNLRCWYCYEQHIPGSQMTSEVMFALKRLIDKITESNKFKVLQLGFFGGEPFLKFDECAVEIINYADQQCKNHDLKLSINFTTNGTFLDERIIKYLSGFDCGFQITLDGGKQHHDKTRFFRGGNGTFETILKNIELAAKYKISTIVRINYTDSNIDSVSTIYDKFHSLKGELVDFLRFDFQRVWQTKSDGDDEAEEKASSLRMKFNESGLTVLPNFILNNVVSPCYGDMNNYLMVNYNGDIFGCTARDFTSDNRIGYLTQSGEVAYDIEKLKLRNNSQLSKRICRDCRIAPLCGGGCKQNASESYNQEICHMGYSEEDKDRIVRDIIFYTLYPQMV